MGGFFDTALANLSKWNVIVGLTLIVAAFVTVMTATPLVNKLLKTEDGEKKTALAAKIKLFAMAFAIVGFIFALVL